MQVQRYSAVHTIAIDTKWPCMQGSQAEVAQKLVITPFKMLPVTELMNIPDATFVKSTQSSATTEQTQHH